MVPHSIVLNWGQGHLLRTPVSPSVAAGVKLPEEGDLTTEPSCDDAGSPLIHWS